MAISERGITPRFKLHIPLFFHRMEALSEGEQQAKAINISTRAFTSPQILPSGSAGPSNFSWKCQSG